MKLSIFDSRLLAAVLLAVMAAAPVGAREPEQQGESQTAPADAENARSEDQSLEAITIIGGAVTDARNPRWVEGDADKPVLPVVSEDAFLDEVAGATAESQQQR